MNKLDLEKVEEPEIKLLDHRKSKRIPRKNFCFIDYAKAFDRVDHNKLENSTRDGITRPYLSPEKPVWKSRSNS